MNLSLLNGPLNREACQVSYAGPLEVESDQLKARLEKRIRQAAAEKFEIVVPKEIRNAA